MIHKTDIFTRPPSGLTKFFFFLGTECYPVLENTIDPKPQNQQFSLRVHIKL